MSKKRTAALEKDLRQEVNEQSSRSVEEVPDQKVRILQDNLVFVNALPSDASSKELLTNELHFPRYGVVSKLIINPSYPNKRGVIYQAYVTYTNHLDAALAIVALDGYKLSDRPLKVSFGTTKYCSHFIRGNSCPNPDCFYLHSVDKAREVNSGDTRTIFKQQNSKAMTYVIDNLVEIAGKALDNGEDEEMEEGFPSITETLEYLVDNDEIQPLQLAKAFDKAKVKRQAALKAPIQQPRVQSVVDSKQVQRQKQPQKLVKSNSHSTMSTPTKQDDLVHVPQKKQQQKPQQKEQVKAQQKIEPKVTEIREIVNTQNSIGKRELKLQQKIQKLIIKEIWKKGNSQCRSRFVKGVTASREECSRLKGIVQKFLIAQN